MRPFEIIKKGEELPADIYIVIDSVYPKEVFMYYLIAHKVSGVISDISPQQLKSEYKFIKFI